MCSVSTIKIGCLLHVTLLAVKFKKNTAGHELLHYAPKFSLVDRKKQASLIVVLSSKNITQILCITTRPLWWYPMTVHKFTKHVCSFKGNTHRLYSCNLFSLQPDYFFVSGTIRQLYMFIAFLPQQQYQT